LKKASTIATENGVKAIQVMKEGNVASEIVKFAKKERIDLIAIGSRGLSRVPRYVLGSISNKIANYAPCQVLIVK
jgi:nucleotide-binding universal stress UspA family protein